MAGNAAQVMTEDDDRTDVDQQDQQDGQQPQSGLRPVVTPPINRESLRPAPEVEYEALEVDDNDQPVGGERRDANLSTEESGTQPLVDAGNQADGFGRTDQRRARGPRETPRERRERTRKAKDRDQNEIARLQREIAQLRQQQDDGFNRIEPRLNEFDQARAQSQLRDIDAQIAQHNAAIQTAAAATRKAMVDNDPDAFTAAQEARENAVIAKTRAELAKERLTASIADTGRARQQDDAGDGRQQPRSDGRQQPQQQRQQPQQVSLNRSGQRLRNEFVQEFDFLTSQNDQYSRRDARIVQTLDNEVASDGFDPNTEDYWDELRERMRDYLPHVFDDDGERQAPRNNAGGRQNGNGHANGQQQRQAQQQTQTRRGPAVTGPANGGSGGVKRQVKISPARKESLIQMNVLGADGRIIDEPKFKRMLAKYDEFDRANGTGQ